MQLFKAVDLATQVHLAPVGGSAPTDERAPLAAGIPEPDYPILFARRMVHFGPEFECGRPLRWLPLPGLSREHSYNPARPRIP
jgi:hypothetical protein